MADAVTNVASALENDMGSRQRTELAKNLVGPIGTLLVPDAESSDESSTSEVKLKPSAIYALFYKDIFL